MDTYVYNTSYITRNQNLGQKIFLVFTLSWHITKNYDTDNLLR